MSDTKISWAHLGLDRGVTWNPIAPYGPDGKRGWACVKINDACKFCYAETLNQNLRFGNGLPYSVQGMQQSRLELVNLDQPLRWKKPRGIFVESMSDLFGEFVPREYTNQIMLTALLADWHRLALLTKRFNRMVEWVEHSTLTGLTRASHIWWGMTVGHQKAADEALPYMRRMRELLGPNAILWVSYEPALEAVNWRGWETINWLVAGQESGKHRRPMDLSWVRYTRDWCITNSVAFYFKQVFDEGKKVEKPELDGQTWLQFPP